MATNFVTEIHSSIFNKRSNSLSCSELITDMQKIIWAVCLLACMGCRETTLEWGQKLLAAKNYEKAQEALTLWIQSDTTRWEAYYDRARCETELYQYSEALADYEKAYAMHPAAKTCTGLGKGYWDLNDTEKAKSYLNRAIGMDPTYADAYLNLGIIYTKEEAFRVALPYLLKAKSLADQPSDELSMALMIVYFETGNDPACLEIIQSFKSSDTLTSDAYQFHGRLYQRKKQYQKALKEFDAALDIDSTNGFARLCRADTYSALKQFDLEIGDRTRIIRAMEAMDDNAYLTGQSYYYRGIAKGNAGDNRGALQDFNQSLAIAGDAAGTYFNRAIAKIHLHDLPGALRDYQKAKSLEPSLAFDDYLKEEPKDYAGFFAYCKKRGVQI
jgi:tetratricopeptide (TPR) repeat protein